VTLLRFFAGLPIRALSICLFALAGCYVLICLAFSVVWGVGLAVQEGLLMTGDALVVTWEWLEVLHGKLSRP
jgi:hypothetical protein